MKFFELKRVPECTDQRSIIHSDSMEAVSKEIDLSRLDDSSMTFQSQKNFKKFEDKEELVPQLNNFIKEPPGRFERNLTSKILILYENIVLSLIIII